MYLCGVTNNNTKMITIRKSVPAFIADDIEFCMKTAMEFMTKKYPDVKFDVDFIFSNAGRGSKYFRNSEENSKYKRPTLFIVTRDLLMLYDMKTLNIIRRKLVVDEYIQTTSALIHELTHHVQYETGLPIGELLTTSNELEFLKENHYEIWDYLMVN